MDILKYITKEFEEMSLKDIVLFFKATCRRRLLFTFGNFYGIKIPEKKKKFQYIKPHSEEYNMYYGIEPKMSRKEMKRKGYV